MKNICRTIILTMLAGTISVMNTNAEEKAKNVTPQEYRAVWYNVYSIDVSNEDTAKRTIDGHFELMDQMGINAIFLLVKFPDGDAYYPSKICPVKTTWDCLDYVIKKSREYKMEIHAYLNAYEDKTLVTQNPAYMDYTKSGPTGSWCSPAVKEVNERNLSIIKEIAENYKIDGIQLDRIRYTEGGGYNPESIRLFKEKCGHEPLSETEPEWVQFRKDLISDFVAQAYKTLKSVNPKLKLSAAVFHSPTTSAVRFQDWPKWVKNNCIDFICTMSYTATQTTFEKYVNENIQAVQGTNVPLYIGIGPYYKGMTAEILRKQMEYVRQCGLPGMIFFSAYSLFDGVGFPDVLKDLYKGAGSTYTYSKPRVPSVEKVNINKSIDSTRMSDQIP